MASAHIEIPSTTRLGADLRAMIDVWQRLYYDAEAAKAVYDQLALGGDWAALAGALGLTGPTAATEAEALYNLLGSALPELQGTFTTQLLARAG